MMNLDRELLFRFFNKETTLEEEKKIRLWIDECDEHRCEFFRERQLFDAILLHGDPSYEKSRPRFYIPWHKVVATLSGIAAIVILTIITTTYFLQQSFRDEVMNTVTVPQGQRVHLTLSDGTKVWLNAKTKMEYPQSFKVSDQRIVKVDGEAYFEVSKTGQPFIVNVNGMQVEVLGTTFNISAYPNEEYQTTLVNGSVRVSAEKGESLILKPSQQATIALGSNSIQVRTVDTSFYTSWVKGKINFKDQRLEDIMKTLSRWYDMNVVYENEKLKNIRFGCNLNRYEEITPFVKLLEKTEEVHVKIEGNTITFHN